MTARTNHSGAISGLFLWGCVAMGAFVMASQAWTAYAPTLRAFLLRTDPVAIFWITCVVVVIGVLSICGMAAIEGKRK